MPQEGWVTQATCLLHVGWLKITQTLFKKLHQKKKKAHFSVQLKLRLSEAKY